MTSHRTSPTQAELLPRIQQTSTPIGGTIGPKNWIAVASAAHARQGREGGYMQVCHGKLFTFGLFGISDHAMQLIAQAMGADEGVLRF